MPFFLGIAFFLLFLGGCTPHSPRQAGSPIRIRWASDPVTLDPLALANQNATDATILLHTSLLQADFQSRTYAPALANSLPTIRLLGDSLLQLDYRLRPEATWDDGHPVLATDVAFTLKLINCPDLPNEELRAQVSFIADCQLDPTDPRHLIFICRGQAREYAIASGDFPIVPENALDPRHTLRAVSLASLRTAHPPAAVAALVRRYRQANIAHHPERLPGCGPYRLVSWQPNQRLVFERKAVWWADRLPQPPFVLVARPRQLQFLILPDATAAILAMQRHELDVFPQVPVRVFERLRASAQAPAFLFSTTASYDVVVLGFNTSLPALQNKYTRQALTRLLDPAGLQQATQRGQGIRTASLVPPSSPFYYNDSLPLPRQSLSQAAALLRQAGWRHQADSTWRQSAAGPPLSLSVRYRSDDQSFAAICLQLRAAAAKLGIAVELRPTDATTLTETLHTGDFGAYVRTLKGNPFVFDFSSSLHSKAIGLGNFTGFRHPATDQLLDAIAAEGRPQLKRHLLRKLQASLYDQVPLFPLFFLPSRLVASRQLRHLTVSGLKPGYVATALSWGPDTAATTGR